MAEFPAFTISPARVHESARRFTGHHPAWLRRPYDGGIWSIEHYRVCSYCGCIHPVDLITLLGLGKSKLEETTKPGKYLFLTPNPAAGILVCRGSLPVRVLNWVEQPRNLMTRLHHEASERDATMAERLVGHIERPVFEPAPELIRQPFYSEHASTSQWAEIETAADLGDHHGSSLPGT